MVINLIKAHYRAYQKSNKQEDLLNEFLRSVSDLNDRVMFDSPYQTELENLIYANNTVLYTWYIWYLYEPGHFMIDDRAYNATELTLDEFLEIVK